MSRHEDRRRGRTRWTLLLAVGLLAALLAGTEALTRARPVADIEDMRVEDLPIRAVSAADPISCVRGVDDDTVTDIQEELVTGGTISSRQVYACPEAFDGLRVTFVGEAVGDVLHRDGGAWVQVNDDDYALEVGPLGRHDDRRGPNTGLPVWLPDGLHEEISAVGGPGRRGDVLLLEGVLLRTDPEDGGGTTLRADSLEVVAASVTAEEPLHVAQVIVAVLLGLIAIGALLWSQATKQR